MIRKAFTLIELVMVIVVMAIMAVVAISRISVGPNKLDGAASKLASDLRYAQQLAINSHQSCGISFNPTDNTYFVYIGTTSTKARDPHTRKDLELDYDTDSESSGVNLSYTNFGNDISFDYLGTPYDSTGSALSSQGYVTINYDYISPGCFGSGSGYTTSVTIEPNTGMVGIL